MTYTRTGAEQMTEEDKRYLTAGEAAKIFPPTATTIRNWGRRGILHQYYRDTAPDTALYDRLEIEEVMRVKPRPADEEDEQTSSHKVRLASHENN